MQFDSFQRQTPTINVSALIDVIFILLIFVVLAANFDRIREMSVTLPTADETMEATQDALVVTVPVDEPMLLEGEPIDEAKLFDELVTRSEDYDVLVLVGDGQVGLNQTVEIFDMAKAAGFDSVSIATREEGR